MSRIVLVNDILGGCMGERVLWNYLLEGIPDISGVDGSNVPMNTPNWEKAVESYIDEHHPDCEIVIQNATFIPLVHPGKFTIVYLQDNLRAMGRRSNQQEETLKNADLIVTNSILTTQSYPEYDMEIIPIGIDDELFHPDEKLQKSEIPVGVFVGAMNSVKGWSKVKSIIDRSSNCSWIVVSKHEGESYNKFNCRTYNQLNQTQLNCVLQSADFFILGSPVETQCLAALEAGFVNLPIVMHNTGIFADMDDETKSKLGYFGDDFEKGIEYVLHNDLPVRETLMDLGFGIQGMIDDWIELLSEVKP